jgi:hypothetical protein
VRSWRSFVSWLSLFHLVLGFTRGKGSDCRAPASRIHATQHVVMTPQASLLHFSHHIAQSPAQVLFACHLHAHFSDPSLVPLSSEPQNMRGHSPPLPTQRPAEALCLRERARAAYLRGCVQAPADFSSNSDTPNHIFPSASEVRGPFAPCLRCKAARSYACRAGHTCTSCRVSVDRHNVAGQSIPQFRPSLEPAYLRNTAGLPSKLQRHNSGTRLRSEPYATLARSSSAPVLSISSA